MRTLNTRKVLALLLLFSFACLALASTTHSLSTGIMRAGTSAQLPPEGCVCHAADTNNAPPNPATRVLFRLDPAVGFYTPSVVYNLTVGVEATDVESVAEANQGGFNLKVSVGKLAPGPGFQDFVQVGNADLEATHTSKGDRNGRVFNLTWTGHYKLGLADCIMLVVTGFCPAHTYETEPLVEPVAKAGVRVDIPANVSWLEFELRWQGNERLHLMIHGPMKADHSMPSYMAMGGSPGRACIAIPTAQILPGMWEVMAHAGSPGYQDTPFKILINGEGAKDAKLRAGPHGHPVREDWSMDMKQAVGCR